MYSEADSGLSMREVLSEAQILREMLDTYEEAKAKWSEAFADTVETMAAVRETRETIKGNEKVMYSEGDVIYLNMPDNERTNVLKKMLLNVVEFNDSDVEISEAAAVRLKNIQEKNKNKVFRTLGEKFGVFKQYANENINLEFEYSRGSMHKSIHTQGKRHANFSDFCKMLYMFDDVVANAQPIETHKDKYVGTKRANSNLKQDYILLGAFRNKNNIIPVEFNIKEFVQGTKNQLYVSVTLQKIKAEVLEALTDNNQQNASRPASVYSIADIIENINPSDSEFLKYVPDGLLTNEQIKAKNEAQYAEKTRLENMRRELSENNGENNLVYSEDTEIASMREILSDALESVAETEADRNALAKYQAQVKELDAFEAELRETNAQIKELSFAKGKRDTQKIAELKDKAAGLRAKVKKGDSSLLKLESTAPIKAMFESERDRLRRERVTAVREAEREAFAESVANISAANAAGSVGDEAGGDGKVMYSEGDTYDFSKSFTEQIDDYKNSKFPRNDTLIVCQTPAVFREIGLNALPMTYPQGHLKAALVNKDGDHLGEVLLKKLPEALENPIAIIDSASKPGRLVAIIEIPGQTRNTIAAVEVDGEGFVHSNKIDANVITTVHSRDNAINKLLKDAVTSELAGKGGVYYWQKNKAIGLLKTNGVQFPGGSSLADGFIRSITDPLSKVNRKINNITETEQFKKWFGDWENKPKAASKVVNADGTPKVMYHGTKAENGEFWEFDYSKAKRKGGLGLRAMGKGNYFTSIELNTNGRYDRVIPVYLDIKTPFEYVGDSSLAEQVAEKLGIDTSGMDADALQDAMRDAGYDGVIQYDKNGDISVAVTFDSTQIKSAADNIGTFDGTNPDIRYSDPDSDTSMREVLSEALLETAQNDEERALIQKYQEKSDGLYEFDTLKKRYEDENNGVTRTRVTYH